MEFEILLWQFRIHETVELFSFYNIFLSSIWFTVKSRGLTHAGFFILVMKGMFNPYVL